MKMDPKSLKLAAERENFIVQNNLRADNNPSSTNQDEHKPEPSHKHNKEKDVEKPDDKDNSNFSKPINEVMSSSSSSYVTAEEDFEFESPSEDEQHQKTLQYEETPVTSTRTWVTGSAAGLQKKVKNINNEKMPVRKTKSDASFVINNKRRKNKTSPIGKSNLFLESLPGAEINQLQPISTDNKLATALSSSNLTEDEEEFKSLDSWGSDGKHINANELQKVFDCFKSNRLGNEESEKLVDLLGASQNRNDFQWALHQLGGVNALLFLYARVVELRSGDEVQSKGLSLALGQIKNHAKVTDIPPCSHYNLIRFVLNNERSSFGFKSFIILVHHCLNPSGNKLIDYALLNTCLLSSWRILIKIRCTDAEAPTGRRSLFECLLTVLLDLLLEKNVHRSYNIALLKANNFSDRLLSICCNMIFESSSNQGNESSSPSQSGGDANNVSPNQASTRHSSLSSIDALRISALVKSIFSEMMAPPDAYVAVSVVEYGLYPLLPKDLPPLPEKQDATFLFQHKAPRCAAEAAEEQVGNINEDQTQGSPSHNNQNQESLENVVMMNEDIPEIVGKTVNNNLKIYNKDTFEQSQYDKFRETFEESLIEALMSVLLNNLAVLPDGAFFSVLKPHLQSHLFVAYCAYPNVTVKIFALKLIASYLSRVKNPCVTDFMKNRGFFLTGLYVQNEPDTSLVVARICEGLGPVSYPLVVALLKSNTMLSTVLEWVENDASGNIPALMSMGLIPAILNMYRSSQSVLPRPLSSIISLAIKYNVLNPKEDPWKVLFSSSLESAPVGCKLTGRFYQEAILNLKNYEGKELKKVDLSQRLLWLIERSAASRFSNNFDKWLIEFFTSNIMELDLYNTEETENWKYFVKKNKKRLNYLLGVFLSKAFIPHKGDLEVKNHILKVLLQNCPTLQNWLPKVLKCDPSIERCFTAFLRIFMVEANQKESEGEMRGSGRRSPSFQSLLAEGLSLQLNPKTQLNSRQDVDPDEILSAEKLQNQEVSLRAKEVDKAIRKKFENILVDEGILSPTNNFSTFSADFKKFKILLETPPICGVSYQELRQCLATLEKMRANLIPAVMSPITYLNPLQSESKGNIGKGYFCNAAYFESIFETAFKFAIEVLDSVTRIRTKMGVDIVKSICTREADITARKRWWAITHQLGHPKAPWHFQEFYPKFWALDQSEGPSRIRIRLHKEHLKIHNRFVLPKFRMSDAKIQHHPLDYLFQSDQDYDELMTFPTIKTEIQYMRFCMRIIPGEEINGEVILSTDTLYFIPELHTNSTDRPELVEFSLTSVVHILRRRYTLEDKAIEVFVGSQSFFFVFRNFKDREEFMSVVQIKPTFQTRNTFLLEKSVSFSTMTNRWAKGHLSNFDYLMMLNTAAGRTNCDLMQYPVFPFCLSKYDSPTLDLHAPQSYRDLKKPMAIQDASKEPHFSATYNYLKRECDSAPFHYGSHYSNSGIVLHYLIRLPPYTQHFLKYQDGSFDIPDRSFHSLETTWRLAARDSNTDFKEAIPEFYYLPEFLQNLQHFDFGVRQNGMRVDNVDLPQWAKNNPRLFTLINRQALESNHVRKLLCEWIDLIFGYKQMGKAAVKAMNVFHPSTYEGFEIEGVGDELLTKARRAMVSTYGQTPKQLFSAPHPRSMFVSVENCDMEVLDTVWGIRWGTFLGSPTCSELEVVNTRQYSDEMSLFETPTRIVFWPKYTFFMGDTVVGSWSLNEIQIKSNVIYMCIGDEITTCATTENSIWIGHHSGKITVLKLSQSLEKVLETFELVGHYKPIKNIDLNIEFSTAVSCSGENHALIFDMCRISYINLIQRNSSIDSVYSSRSTGDIAVTSLSSNTVTLTTINGFEIGTVQPEEKVESACLSSLDPGKNVNLLAIGCDYGYIKFYSTWDLKYINEIKVNALATLPIQSIRYSKDGRRLYSLSTNEEVSISAALQLPDTPR